MSQNGVVFKAVDKANLLARQFESVHHITENMGDQETEIAVENPLNEITQHTIKDDEYILTSPQEIMKVIRKLKSKKAPGHDGIQNLILKNLNRKAIVQITYIFNACLKLAYFPESWKTAIILPFPKPGKDKHSPQNYRPISLLPTLGKLLENIILNRIKKHEQEHKQIISEQFIGFTEKKGTTLQLARVTNCISENFNKNKSTGMVLIDIEKAFDTVWHKGLIHKLSILNLPTFLIKIIYNYLNNRKFKVKVKNELSEEFNVTAGVPQGSILEPSLFLYYINDITKSPDNELAIFADDTAMYTQPRGKQIMQ